MCDGAGGGGLRLGLCCQFAAAPIRFRATTAARLRQLAPDAAGERLAEIVGVNTRALEDAIRFCHDHAIGAFRITSKLLPVATHPEVGYDVVDLPGGGLLRRGLAACGALARGLGVRLSFHPDQFIVLNSPSAAVVERSVNELRQQAELAAWLGADVINLHAGGVYGDRAGALRRLRQVIDELPEPVRSRLTLENDDRLYSPADLLPVCRDLEIPLVYDVHHHRCHGDGMSVAAATAAALSTWKREPLFHISSPRDGWHGAQLRPHADYVAAADFPAAWRRLALTVDVEAKAKELAVLRLQREVAASAPVPEDVA
jgi:UV DNA damage endonuclease